MVNSRQQFITIHIKGYVIYLDLLAGGGPEEDLSAPCFSDLLFSLLSDFSLLIGPSDDSSWSEISRNKQFDIK